MTTPTLTDAVIIAVLRGPIPTREQRTIAADRLASLSAQVEALAKHVDAVRPLLAASDADCPYCGLAASEMFKCERGFPGCARADDLSLHNDRARMNAQNMDDEDWSKYRAAPADERERALEEAAQWHDKEAASHRSIIDGGHLVQEAAEHHEYSARSLRALSRPKALEPSFSTKWERDDYEREKRGEKPLGPPSSDAG